MKLRDNEELKVFRAHMGKMLPRLKAAAVLALRQPFRLRPLPEEDDQIPGFNEWQAVYKENHDILIDQEALIPALAAQSVRKYDETFDALTTVESKADWLMGFLAALCGFAAFHLNDVTQNRVAGLLWFLGIIATLPGLSLCLRSRLPAGLSTVTPLDESIKHVIETQKYLEECKKLDPDEKPINAANDLETWLIKSRASAIISLQHLNDWKANCVKAAGYWLMMSVVFFILSMAWTIPHFD